MCMLISDVIKQAQSGELSNLSVKDDIASIIQFINLGLIALYKRFNLSTGEVVIELGKVTGATDSYVRISDTEYQLPEGAGTVLEAYEEDGTMIPINVEDDPYSILTPSWNTVQIPVATKGAFVSIMFAKDPIPIKYTPGADIDDVDAFSNPVLQLPTTLLEALLHYIGYRGHGAIDGNVEAENNTHLMRFNAECDNVKKIGAVTADDMTSSGNLNKKGFV